MWLYGETLTIVFDETPLAQDRVSYQPDLKHLRTIAEPQVFDTIYRSPQLLLWELDDAQWLKMVRRPRPPRRKPTIQSTWPVPLPLIAA